jgi:hypothetical protein
MDDYDDVTPAEAARDRRRDHDAGARERAGMKSGLAKQFKQVLDVQGQRARDAERELAEERLDEERRRARAGGKAGKGKP